MRTLFEAAPFKASTWAPQGPSLGLTITDIFGEIVGAAPDIYQAYQTGEAAEEARKKAEADAAAAAARAQAAAAQAVAAQATTGSSQMLGIPTSYWVIGGVGLAALGVILAVAK